MTWKPELHPRDTGGTFAEKPMTAPKITLEDFLLEPKNELLGEWDAVLHRDVDGSLTSHTVVHDDGGEYVSLRGADGITRSVEVRNVARDPDGDPHLAERSRYVNDAVNSTLKALADYSDDEISGWEESLVARNLNPAANLSMDMLAKASDDATDTLVEAASRGEIDMRIAESLEDPDRDDLYTGYSRLMETTPTKAIVLNNALRELSNGTPDTLESAWDDFEDYRARRLRAEGTYADTEREFAGVTDEQVDAALDDADGELFEQLLDDDDAFTELTVSNREVFPLPVFRSFYERPRTLKDVLFLRVAHERAAEHLREEFYDLDPEAFQRAERLWMRVKEHLEARR